MFLQICQCRTFTVPQRVSVGQGTFSANARLSCWGWDGWTVRDKGEYGALKVCNYNFTAPSLLALLTYSAAISSVPSIVSHFSFTLFISPPLPIIISQNMSNEILYLWQWLECSHCISTVIKKCGRLNSITESFNLNNNDNLPCNNINSSIQDMKLSLAH